MPVTSFSANCKNQCFSSGKKPKLDVVLLLLSYCSILIFIWIPETSKKFQMSLSNDLYIFETQCYARCEQAHTSTNTNTHKQTYFDYSLFFYGFWFLEDIAPPNCCQIKFIFMLISYLIKIVNLLTNSPLYHFNVSTFSAHICSAIISMTKYLDIISAASSTSEDGYC